MNGEKAGNLPEKKFSTGAISATIWKNNGTNKKDGGPVEYRTITLQRRYTDKEGKWQTSNSLRLNDLPKASLVLQKAYEYLVLKGQGSSSDKEKGDNGSMMDEEIVM
ncbi:hypothetical protein KY358_01360 [Candidatus Woesearchaeota archaeon]|nr:hypothetical protein [Candidatus Woesearchaeota archaeon]